MDYKQYSLSKLEEWIHDAISNDVDITDIYNCIYETVRENYETHRCYANRSYELMKKLHGNQSTVSHEEMISKGHEMTADGFWIPTAPKTFTTTVEIDPMSEECYIRIPPEILQKLGWTEETMLIMTVQDDKTLLIRKE